MPSVNWGPTTLPALQARKRSVAPSSARTASAQAWKWVRFARATVCGSASGASSIVSVELARAARFVCRVRSSRVAAEQGRFEPLVVAGQTGELGFVLFIFERVDSAVEERRFESADAAQVPGGVDDAVEELGLEDTLRLKFGEVGGVEFVEGGLVVGADDEFVRGAGHVSGCSSMTPSCLPGSSGRWRVARWPDWRRAFRARADRASIATFEYSFPQKMKKGGRPKSATHDSSVSDEVKFSGVGPVAKMGLSYGG